MSLEGENSLNVTAKIKIALTFVVIAIGLIAADITPAASGPKGIILFIGDGMGINQVRAADLYSRHVLKRGLVINSIPTIGVATTHSADSNITDSSSAATALYTGRKINNSVINILPDGKELSTIGHSAKKAGLSVGVVTTTRITHATPAALYSRAPHRNCEAYIAEQLADFSPDVALGGGLQYFVPENQPGSKRKDDLDLIGTMRDKGYEIVTDRKQLKNLKHGSGKILGLFSASHIDYALDRENEPAPAAQPTLADMTGAALSILEKNPRGFFVMIEGGRIDHACHAHDIKAMIHEVLEFDAAIRTALEFQKRHPDVLVLVTADHETGGLELGNCKESSLAALKPIKNSLEHVSRKIVKDPAGTDNFLEKTGFRLGENEKVFVHKHSQNTQAGSDSEPTGDSKGEPHGVQWLLYALGSIEAERSGVGWSSFGHTAQPVLTRAVGPGENKFSGSYDNTDIAKRMAELLGLPLEQPRERTKEMGSKCAPK